MTRPGAVPLAARAVAPDVARGVMLLLIALANVHLYLYGRPVGVRLYPADPAGADRAVALVQMTLVDGRAYPLFGLLFGYGIGQLTARRADAEEAVIRRGAAATHEVRGGRVGVGSITAIVRRRGFALLGIGVAHVALAWSGDVVAAYGLLAVLLGRVLVAGTAVSLLTAAVLGVLVEAVLGAYSGLPAGGTAPLPSVAVDGPAAAAAARLAEWGGGILAGSLVALVGAVAFGAWAARHRVLDDPTGGQGRRPLLARVAVAGVAGAVLGGLPLALAAAGLWRPGAGALLLAGTLHTLGGFAGGLGYAAAFGLLATRLDAAPGPVTRALAACGQRSLSCYLGQSVLFAALLPAWALGWGARLGVAQAALLAVAVWSALLLAAVASAAVGYRGPAEVLLRRLTYGPTGPGA